MSDYRVEGAREYFNSPHPSPQAQRRGSELLEAADDRLRWLAKARAELARAKKELAVRRSKLDLKTY